MKKNFLLVLSLFFTINFIFSQNIKITYSKHFDLPAEKYLKYLSSNAIKEMKKKTYHFLIKNDSASIFVPIEKPKKIEIIDTTVVDDNNTNIYRYVNNGKLFNVYYINYKKGYYKRKLHLNGQKFDIYDSIPKLNWTILDDTEKLKGYTIQKAITNYHGIKIIAWFTEDIPVSVGPRIFSGLPGLIMKLKMNMANYEVEKIEYLQKVPNIKPPKPETPYITDKELELIFNKNKMHSQIIEKKCATCPE